MATVIEVNPLELFSLEPLPAGDSCVLVIFGASGDLTKRKLIPALYNLACVGCMNPQFEVLGVGRTPMSSEDFRSKLRAAASKSSDIRDFSESGWLKFESRLHYLVGDVNDGEFRGRLRERLDEMQRAGSSPNRLFYVSTPASVAGPIIEGLALAGLNRSDGGWTRIILEKPFGHDLKSAQDLNAVIHKVFDENDVYRIDHYLGKETVQNILVFRFGNSLFEPVWNRNYIDYVEITTAETVGVEGRAAPKANDKSGDALATALLGLPQTAVRTLGPNRIDGRQKNYAAFVQDDFRIVPSLTVNMGLRYEVSPPLVDIRHQMSSIDFSTVPSPQAIFANGQQGVYSPLLFVCGRDGYPHGCAHTNWKNFSPRLGLAWSLNSRTVIRAGGGIYYGTQDDNTLRKLAQTLPDTYNQTLTFNAFVPQNSINNVFSPAVVGSASIQAAALDLHQGTPYSPQWSFNIQRSLGWNTVIEAGYLGSAGIHLEQNVQINNSMPAPVLKRAFFGLTLAPSILSALQFPLTNSIVPVTAINFFPRSAQSNYHALLLRVERKFSSGFSLLSSFTWSKAITNAPQYRNAGGITGDENSPPQNSFNLSADRGLAYFNTKFRSVTSAIYDLPFGKGKKLLSEGLPAAVLGGWQVSGVLQLQTGFPFTINYKGDPINVGGGSGGILVRPNYALDANGKNVDPNLPADRRTTGRYFNTAAFLQPIYSFGNVGRNSMTGAKLINLDATVARTLRLTDKCNLQFRTEFFNLANHPNYGLIGRIVNDPTFGIVQNQLPPRQIQMALKLSF